MKRSKYNNYHINNQTVTITRDTTRLSVKMSLGLLINRDYPNCHVQ